MIIIMNFMQKTILFLITLYMRYKTKQGLDFKYTDENITVPSYDKEKKYLLYLHIPFCKTLCPYCSFHKFIYHEDVARKYFALLREEMLIAKKKGFNFRSMYVGGGTTTLLPDELAQTIDLAKELFDIEEVSCESDPDINEEMIEILSARINRLSVGVQSFDDDILKRTTRYKKFGTGIEQFEKIKKLKGKFKIVNIDMIFNMPNEPKSIIEKDLQKLQELNPQQISYYPLMHSPSVKQKIERNLGRVHNDHEYEYYLLIEQELSKRYEQISAWTYVDKTIKTKIFDEYVVDYDEYLGLGSGSFSFIADKLYINAFSLQEYKKKVESNELSIQRVKQYSKRDIGLYRLMITLFSMQYDENIQKEHPIYTKLMVLFKILDKQTLKTTLFGNYLFMRLMKEFYIGMDFVRESSRKDLTKEDQQL